MSDGAPNIRSYRQDFPMLAKQMQGKPLIYLDSAATAQKPQVVIDTITDFLQNNYGTVHRAVYELAVHSSEAYSQARTSIRQFLNAERDEETIFTRGTTAAINLVAYSFGKAFVKPGDEILISEMEHHANIIPWQMLCEDRGAVLRVIPINDAGEIDLDAYRAMLSERTKLVSVVHVSNTLGTVNPVKRMAEMARVVGAKFMADGAQALPSMPVDVQDLGVDFYAFSGHKAYGPTGVGVLYGRRELLEQMPPYQGGGDMIDEVRFEKTTYAPLPLKFEAGTPSIAEVIGLGSAIDYMNGIGMGAIAKRKRELLDYALPKLQGVDGVRLIGMAKERSSILSFCAEGAHPLDIGTLLDFKGVAVRTGHHCTQPTMRRFGVSATVRASFAFYNTEDEIDQFIEHLKAVLKVLRG